MHDITHITALRQVLHKGYYTKDAVQNTTPWVPSERAGGGKFRSQKVVITLHPKPLNLQRADFMGEQRYHYSDDEKENAVRCYVAGGSYAKAEAMCGVRKEAIAVWKHRDPQWWEDTITKIHMEMEEQYRAGWREVLGLGLDAMQDRLRNGNHMPVKSKNAEGGWEYTMLRVPVPAKDAVVISGIAADKLRVSMGLPNRITGKIEDNDRLEELRKMAEASRKARTDKEPEGKTIN